MEMIGEKVLEKMKRHFPRARGRPRVDDRRVISGIVYVLRNGLRWQDAPKHHGGTPNALQPFFTVEQEGDICQDFRRIGEGERKVVHDRCAPIKAHRTAASLKGERKNAKSAAQKAA